MAEKVTRIVIIGGGITGLSCAYRLQNRLSILGRPCEIFIIEASNRLGGALETVRRDGFLLEKGADSFISEKPRGLGLCQDLAISSLLIETQEKYRRSFIAQGNKLHPIPRGFHLLAPTDPLAMISTSLLSLKGKARVFKEPFVPALQAEDESLGSFVRRRFGLEVLERLAQPIINGIYGADPETLSMRATFPQFLKMEQEGNLLFRGLSKNAASSQASGARYSLMMSFKDGMQTFVNEITGKIKQVKIYLNLSVIRLEGREAGWGVTLSNQQQILADAVCVALSADAAATVIEATDSGLAQTLRAIPHADSLSTYYAFKKSALGKSIDGAGVLIPASERKSFTACTFAHQKFAGRAPEGHVLLRAFVGGKKADALWGLSDGDIERKIFNDLKAMFQIKASPLFIETYRYRKGLPHYTLGHLDRIEDIRKRLSALTGLAVTGNWRQGIGIPDCIDAGERAAEQLVMDLCRT
jgi:oxygen-dependent protoporphyrinogen oxidase